MTETLKYIKGMNEVLEGSIFNIKQKNQEPHNHKLTGEKFKSKFRKYYLTERLDAWNQLSAEVVGYPSVIEFKYACDKHMYIIQ